MKIREGIVYAVVRSTRAHTQVVRLWSTEARATEHAHDLNKEYRVSSYTVTRMLIHV